MGIGPDVVRALKPHMVAQQRLGADEAREHKWLVVCGPDWKPIQQSSLKRQLQRLMKDAGLPLLSTHALCDTASMLMLTHVLKEALGHAPVSITLDLYSPSSPA